jgi:hypothetical protein
MLLVHEVHAVAGRDADDFEALYREALVPGLASTSDARVLWFLHQAHGTGPAYTVVTLTAVAGMAALAALNDRMRRGDLRGVARDLDAMRHEGTGSVLEPLAWSPLQAVAFDDVPTDAVDRHGPDLPLFMQDTAWPHPGRFHDYVERAGTLYVETLRRAAAHGRNLLDLVGAFTPVHGAGRHPEILLWQRVARPELLVSLLSQEVPAEHRAPGTWMHDALDVRDRWESRLLRVAPWSPLG